MVKLLVQLKIFIFNQNFNLKSDGLNAWDALNCALVIPYLFWAI